MQTITIPRLSFSHIPSDGSKVGGTSGTPSDPMFIAAIPALAGGNTLYLTSGTNNAGSNWSDAEFYETVKTDFSGGYVKVSWPFTLHSSPADATALEFTVIWIYEGFAYNGAFQILMSNSHAMVSSFDQPWKDTGIVVGPIQKDVNYLLEVSYNFSVSDKTRSITSLSINGKVASIPGKYQSVPATASTWQTGEFTLQHQLAQTKQGGTIITELGTVIIS